MKKFNVCFSLVNSIVCIHHCAEARKKSLGKKGKTNVRVDSLMKVAVINLQFTK